MGRIHKLNLLAPSLLGFCLAAPSAHAVTNYVGIGTTSPTYPLQVSSTGFLPLDLDSLSGTDRKTGILFTHGATKDWWIGNDVNGTNVNLFDIYDYNANASRFVIDASGRVGVGTVNPGYSLEIDRPGDAPSGTTGILDLKYTSASNGQALQINQPNAGGDSAPTSALFGIANSGMNPDFNFDNEFVMLSPAYGGYVGIGTTKPAYDLDLHKVNAAGNVVSRFWNESTATGSGAILQIATGTPNAYTNFANVDSVTPYAQIAAASGDTGGLYIEALANASLIFRTNSGAERMRINGSGNVGIGTSQQTRLLHVYGTGGTASLSSSSGEVAYFDNNTSQGLAIGAMSVAPYSMWLQTKRATNDGSSWPLVLNPLGGNVGVGTTSPDAPFSIYKFDSTSTTGTNVAASDVNYYVQPASSSDAIYTAYNGYLAVNSANMSANSEAISGYFNTALNSSTSGQAFGAQGRLAINAGSQNLVEGVDGTVVLAAGTTVTGDAKGIHGRLVNNGGTIANGYASANQIINSGTITVAKSFGIQSIANTGSIGTYYGIYLADPNNSGGGTITTKYALYSLNTGLSYFAGAIQVASCSGCSVIAEMMPIDGKIDEGYAVCMDPDSGKVAPCGEDASLTAVGITTTHAEQILRLGCSESSQKENLLNLGGTDPMFWKKRKACGGWFPVALTGVQEFVHTECFHSDGTPLKFGDRLVSSGRNPGFVRPLLRREQGGDAVIGKASTVCKEGEETGNIHAQISIR